MIVLQTSSAPAVDLLAQADGAARHAKLLQAAQQFEAIMLEVILKPLSKPAAIDGDGADAETGSPLQSFGVEAMASSLAKSGALGFAERITASVEKHDMKSKPKKIAADAHDLPGIADIMSGDTST